MVLEKLQERLAALEAHVERAPPLTAAQAHALVTGITLFPYQLDGVNWLRERMACVSHHTVRTLPFRVTVQYAFFSLYRGQRHSSWSTCIGCRRRHGAILGDEMGLGKTIQTIVVLAELHTTRTEGGRSSPSKPSLILAPLAVINNWARELAEHAPSLRVQRYRSVTLDTVVV